MAVEAPAGYPPSAFCTSCGRDFTGDSLFDQHRVGTHDYTISEGLKLDPPREDGRRCLDVDEMRKKGWYPLSVEEKLTSARHKRRAGFDVELWFDPVAAARVRAAFAGVS